MASLQLRGRSYACVFCWHGKPPVVHHRQGHRGGGQGQGIPGRIPADAAQAAADRAAARRRHHRVRPARRQAPRRPPDLRRIPGTDLVDFRDRYLSTHRESLEDRTVEGIELHFKHLCRALGDGFPIRELKLADLQGYVDRRAKAKGTGGKRLSPATIRKEIVIAAYRVELGGEDGAGGGPLPL